MRPPILAMIVLWSFSALGAESDVVVIANSSFPVAAVDRAELEMIFTSREHQLNGVPLVAFNLACEDQTRATFERVVLHMSPDEVGRFWVDQRIRGDSSAPRQVADEELVARLVAKLPGAISYISEATARRVMGQVRIVARIASGKVLGP